MEDLGLGSLGTDEALEAGEVAVAKAAFLEALAIWKDESAAGRIDFKARGIAQDGLRWLR